MIGEEMQGFFGRHFQHVVNILSLVGALQGLFVVAAAMADFARHIDVRQEVHGNDLDAVSLAGFTAAALDVE